MYRFVSCRFALNTIILESVSFRFVQFYFLPFRFVSLKNSSSHNSKRNETFELILIDKSVGPQESGQREAMQCGMSVGGVAGEWAVGERTGASPPASRPSSPSRAHLTLHGCSLSRSLRTDKLVDEYQFKRSVSYRVGISKIRTEQ